MMAAAEVQELNGKRIIVVEDDYLLATDVCRELRDLGATVLGPAPTPVYAMQLVGHTQIDAAVLDIGLHGTTVFQVAAMLQDRGVPIVFATGSDRASLPLRFRDTPMLEKPLDREKLIAEIMALTHRPVAPPSTVMELDRPVASRDVPAQVFAKALARGRKAS
jgi:DNA-binding response OmpR family regulator